MSDREKAARYLLDKGYTPEQAAAMIKEAEAASQKKNPGTADAAQTIAAKPTVKLPEGYEEPEWFSESGLTYKEDKKIRSSVLGRIGNIIMSPLFEEGIFSNVKDETDKITPEMVQEIDDFGNSGDQTSIAANVKKFREELRAKHNPGGSKITDRNIDIMLEERLTPMIIKDLDNEVGKAAASGKTKRDLILSDPKQIKAIKEQYRGRGWSGDMVDQAFYKVIDERSDDVLYNDQLDSTVRIANDIAKKTGRNAAEIQTEFGIEIEKDRKEEAISRFGKDELERMKLVDELEFLKKNPETNMTKIAKAEARIKEVQNRLQLDAHIDWGGTLLKSGMPARAGVAMRYTYGAYDADGNKVTHSKMSDEEKERQSEITSVMDEIKEAPNFKGLLSQNAKKQYMIMKNLDLAKQQAKAEMDQKLSAIAVKPGMGATPGINVEQQKILFEGKRKLDRINELHHKADIKFEAYSRMELLNEDIALTDKTLGYYAAEAGKILVNKNNLNIFKDLTTKAEMVDAVGGMYEEMGVPMDDAELENVAPDLTMDIVRGGAELTDFAVKMMLLDKAMGMRGILAFTDKLRKMGAVEKAAGAYMRRSALRLKAGKPLANVIEAAAEGAKFEAVSGVSESKVSGFETGLAFYEVGKLMPNMRLANKAMNTIVNGFLKSSVGMTASMEAVAAYEAARNSIANDKDFERTMEESGIIGWANQDEVLRRVVVEMVTAAPFGLRAMTTMRDAGYSKTTIEDLKKVYKALGATGAQDLAFKLKAAIIEGITPSESRRAWEIKDKLEYLRQEGKFNPAKTIEDNLEIYNETVKELGYNPITDQMLEAHEGKPFGQTIIKDTLEYHEKIEYLKGKNIQLARKSKTEIDKLIAEHKALDAATQAIEDAQIADKAIRYEQAVGGKLTDAPPRRVKTQEEIDLIKIRDEVKETKKDEVDWDKFTKDTGGKIRDVFNKVRERVGEDKFIKIINEAIGITKVAKGAGRKVFEIIPKEGFKDKDAFDSFVDTMQSLRADNTKADAIERIDFIEEVLQRIETITKPQEGYIRAVSDKPTPKDMITLPEMELLKTQIHSLNRGSKAGRRAYKAQLDVVRKFIGDNADIISEIMSDTKMTVGEIKKLTSVLPAEATTEQLEAQVDKIANIISKMDTRATRARIHKTLKSVQPKIIENRITGGVVDFISSTKLDAISILWNANTNLSANRIMRLEVLKADAIARDSLMEVDLYTSQINALKTAGNRELALDRIYELNQKIDAGIELTRAETMEMELLEFNDYKRMTRVDLINAERNLKSIVNYGKTRREMTELESKIRTEAGVQISLETLGMTRAQAKQYQERGSYTTAEGKVITDSRNKFIKGLVGWRNQSESFYTLMEYLMRDVPGRAKTEGFFHSFSNDLYRARQLKETSKRQMKSEKAVFKHKAFGSPGTREMSRINKMHEKAHELVITIDGVKQSLGTSEFAKKNINKVYKIWQDTLMDNNSNAFFNMGWGVRAVDGKMKFDAELLRKELEEFMDQYSPVGAKGVTEYAKWQVEQFYPEYYPRLNDAFRLKTGNELRWERNYSPSVKLSESEGDNISVKSLLDAKQDYFIQSMMPGSLKVKQGNVKARMNTNIDGELFLERYIDQMEHFIAFQPVVDRMESVFNNGMVKSAISAKNKGDLINRLISGEGKGTSFIENIKSDSTKMGQNTLEKGLDLIRRNFVRAHLGLNISLFPKQMVALPAYAFGMEGVKLARFMSYQVPTKEMVTAFKELAQSDFIRNRIQSGSMDRDVLEVSKYLETRASKYDGKPRKFTGDWKQDILIMTKLGDMYTILMGGQALYRIKTEGYVKSGMSLNEAKQKAYNDFIVHTNLTQASGYMEDNSYFQRMGSLGKIMTLFQNTPLQYYRIEAMAFTNALSAIKHVQTYKPGTKEFTVASKKLMESSKDLLVYHFILPMLFQSATQGFYLGDDSILDDPDQITAMVLGSGSYIFILGNILQSMVEMKTTGRTFGVQLAGVVPDVAENATKTIEMVFGGMSDALSKDPLTEDDFNKRIFEDGKPLINFIGEMTGLPLISAATLGKGLYDFATGQTDDIRALVGYSGSVMGDFSRSPDFKFMSKFLNKNAPFSDFRAEMRSRYSKEQWDKNEARLRKEYQMYSFFGGHDPIVNALYRGGYSNKEKAEYLYNMKHHEPQVPITLKTIGSTIGLDEKKFNELITNLRRYSVISPEVVQMIRKLEKDKK